MEIAAIADVHSPKYISEYEESLKNAKLDKIELMLFAGDMIYRGKWVEFRRVLNVTRRYFRGRIVACFGNEEYEDIIVYLVKGFPEVIWLNDEVLTLNYGGKTLFIVGTKGVLDRPTKWQRTHIPRICEIYSERLKKISNLLKEGKRRGYTVILLTHYAPTFKTLVGEPRFAWPEMGSERMEKIVLEVKPDIIVHGHAHNSNKTFIQLGETRVYNVALPATHKITMIPLEYGLLKFL